MDNYRRPGFVESLGLLPIKERFHQAMVTLRGAEDVPPSRFDHTSLGLLNPRLALPLWMGRCAVHRQVLLTNLFNHDQTPVEDGWSVRRTRTRDFRGRSLTYDSHNGTDLSVPRGTLAVAPAPGRVARVYAEFNRGGNKVVIDHGDGLMTCSAHLARVLVQEGDELQVSQPYALTGYSGLDGFISFPWGVPHIHFNVWFDGSPVDPFSSGEESSLWIGGHPTPVPADPPHMSTLDGLYDEARVDGVIATCKTARTRQQLSALLPLARRGAHLISEMSYYPTRFPDRQNVYDQGHERRERLYLPFLARDFDGATFSDEPQAC